ncbi:replication fork protection component Swi3-domain-containing protein [Dunaliella salina]|uniref:Replication fork protection component Swi3-domain-containing protein n=1 Tax=Dunaliella salina TaxID=3046 RepID=A0ABQ7GUG4_DUNSA|nr:replication fork protection component Swi3-domain-containing protein [Dunaliella salina]|eukprot:KAF5838213.1 replication fork protection component Swi3-domain-containing protein [Dunaliella salina]
MAYTTLQTSLQGYPNVLPPKIHWITNPLFFFRSPRTVSNSAVLPTAVPMDDWEDDVQIGTAPDNREGHAQNDKPGPAGKEAAKDDAAAGAAKPKKKSKPRPKVTLDLLKEPQGMNDVFCKFPHAMRMQFKGKGHEVGDLQRLLEMYARWQQRIFPYGSFDDFIFKLEKLGSSAIVKNELRELRQGLVKLLAEEQQEEEEHEGGQGAAQKGGTAEQPGVAAAGLQQAPPSAPANPGRPAAAAPQPFPEDEDEEPPNENDFLDEEEELAALQEEQWANAMDAVPDLDEQLFEGPVAAPSRPTAAIDSSSNRDMQAEPSSAAIALGQQAAAGAQVHNASDALSGGAGVAALSAPHVNGMNEGGGQWQRQQNQQQQQVQQQQQQQEGHPMQVDEHVPDASSQRQQLHGDDEDIDDDELLRGAVPMDETEQAPHLQN